MHPLSLALFKVIATKMAKSKKKIEFSISRLLMIIQDQNISAFKYMSSRVIHTKKWIEGSLFIVYKLKIQDGHHFCSEFIRDTNSIDMPFLIESWTCQNEHISNLICLSKQLGC